MSPQRPRVLLVHAITGRARLRVDDPAPHGLTVRGLARALAEHPSIRDVRMTARTGSLLILHEGELREIMEYAEARGLFALAPPRPRPSLRGLHQKIERLDQRIAADTDDALGLGTLAVVALAGAGLWQAANGRLLPAGMTLFSYALEVIGWAAQRESTVSPHRS